MTTISLHNLCKSFGSVVAVNDVSLTIQRDEMLVLVGPSGCGKTTLLRLIAGLEQADSGEILFDAQRMNEIRPKNRNLSFVFQDFALLPHISVFENVAYGLRSRGVPRRDIEKRVTAAAERFRVAHLLNRRPSQLSGGERQRVSLARALVRESAATLFDEPLASLDAPLRQQARKDIMQLHQQKQRPSIYVTHDQSEAMAMGDRLAVMQDGCIVQLDKPMAIYRAPVNCFVADFIGTSINWFEPNELPSPAPEGATKAAVRPEHLYLTSAENAHFFGTISMVNGRQAIIDTTECGPLSIHTTTPLHLQQTVKVTVDVDNVLWFDTYQQLITT